MIEDLKVLLGFTGDISDELEEQLNVILYNTRKRLKALLGGVDPPEELDYIITEVSVIRYNRIGSEGTTSHNVSGESMSFSDDDFVGYRDDINAYISAHKEVEKGKVRFI